MKIVIAYASAGAGHRKAAEAIYEYLKDKPERFDLQLVDVLDKTNFLFKNIYVQGYLFLIHNCKWLWGALYKFTAIKKLEKFNNSWSLFIDSLNSAKFIKYLEAEKPDLIISTHFLPPEIAGYLKERGRIQAKLITVITDFGTHPFWINKNTDFYVVASGVTKQELVEEGIKDSKILEFGIPIEAKFNQIFDKKALRLKFNLLPDLFTILITTGSAGIGPVEKIIQSLHDKAQILIVCANNQKLFKRLKKQNYSNTVIFGYVNNIHELMACSDLVIAKPGGLTTSEILAMELMPIFVSPIPGQEMHNLNAMQQFSIGRYARNIRQISSFVEELIANPEKIEENRAMIKKVKKPDACKEIYNAIR